MPIPHKDAHRWVGEGWQPLVQRLIEELEAISPDFEIMQVKEKFGGLRFYAHFPEGLVGEMQEVVDRAEADSLQVCERCGKPGTTDDDGAFWLKTLCEGCRADRLVLIAHRRKKGENV